MKNIRLKELLKESKFKKMLLKIFNRADFDDIMTLGQHLRINLTGDFDKDMKKIKNAINKLSEEEAKEMFEEK